MAYGIPTVNPDYVDNELFFKVYPTTISSDSGLGSLEPILPVIEKYGEYICNTSYSIRIKPSPFLGDHKH